MLTIEYKEMLLKQPCGLLVVFSPMIVAIASQKGGVGKTSSAISLAAGLARKNKRVLLIDIDSQANSSKVLLEDYQAIPKEQTLFATILGRQPLKIRPSGHENLDIVPSHILL